MSMTQTVEVEQDEVKVGPCYTVSNSLRLAKLYEKKANESELCSKDFKKCSNE